MRARVIRFVLCESRMVVVNPTMRKSNSKEFQHKVSSIVAQT